MIDGKQIGKAIINVLQNRFGTAGEVVAVDGKAICSTSKPGNPHSARQILSAYVTSGGITLAQESIHEKANKFPVFQQMLTYWDVEGKTVTADAMHCQRETCRRIIQRKGDYLFGLKENQPSLLKDVCVFLRIRATEMKGKLAKQWRKMRDGSRNEFAAKSRTYPG